MVSLSLFPRLLAAQDLDIKAMVGEDWYGLYFNGQKAGYASEVVAIEDDGAVRVKADACFMLRMGGIQQDMRIFVNRFYAPEGNLLRIEQEVQDIGGPKRFDARVEGDSMTLVTTIGGATQEKRLPKPRESLRDALKQQQLVGGDAKVGDELTFCIFEPLYGKEIDGVSRVTGIEEWVLDGVATKVFEIKSDLPAMQISSTAYVTGDGTTLEDAIGGTIKMRLEPKEMAQDVDYSNDVIISNAAMVTGAIANPRTRSTLRLRITGPLANEHVFNGESQQLTQVDGAYLFTGTRLTLEGFEAAHLPIEDATVREWLEPTPFVQNNDPKIVEKAREIVGDETDAFVVSSTLCHWVYANVRTTFSAQLTNTLEVLARLEGDCTEHSILFIGLARAAGLPARETAGLIYVEDHQPGFYFHQWAMVWVGKWIDVDPTFDQPIADATHVKLAEGDLFEQAKLIPTIGQLRIEVVDGDPQVPKEAS